MPSLIVGSSPAFLDCNEGSKLLLLTRNGSLYLWECIGSRCLLKESVLPLLAMSSDSCDKGTFIFSLSFSWHITLQLNSNDKLQEIVILRCYEGSVG